MQHLNNPRWRSILLLWIHTPTHENLSLSSKAPVFSIILSLYRASCPEATPEIYLTDAAVANSQFVAEFL